ncbi:hypothetical protein TNCV_3019951 [Trichonephila clavipes]|nr:hypothetical protein TNCV_3019951 [Trichonephila clavipes]
MNILLIYNSSGVDYNRFRYMSEAVGSVHITRTPGSSFNPTPPDHEVNLGVRRHLDAFTRGRIIAKLEESRSVTSVAAEFGIAHSIVSRLWRQFQTTGTAIRGFSSGRP